MTCQHTKRSLFSLLLALMLVLALPAFAQQEKDPFELFAQWTDELGQPQSVQAEPIPYAGYENSFWLQLPAGVLPQNAALFIQDNFGFCAYFDVQNGTTLENVLEAGTDLASAVPLEITGFDTMGYPSMMLRLYVSTYAPMPEEPRAEVQPVEIRIFYLDQDSGLPIASETAKVLPEGTHTIWPEAWDLLPNYTLSGDEAYTVTVNEFGADRTSVTFYYKMNPPQPATVTVHYMDADTNTPVASATQKTITQNGEYISPEPWDLQPNYELTGETGYSISLDYNGASPAEVTFYYRKQAPQPATVTVHYMDADTNTPVASATQKTITQNGEYVSPEPWDLQPYYELTGETGYSISLDYNGASPAEVTFYYRKQAQAVTLPIRYLDMNSGWPVATESSITCQPGTVTDVTANPQDLQPDFVPADENQMTQQVVVDEYGVANVTEVVFYYLYMPPTPAPTEVPPTPAPTEAPTETPAPQPVTVPVYYLNLENDQPVASADSVEVQPGTEVTVSANPRDLQPDFVPADENQMAQQVVVDEYGVANVTEVVFYYLYMPPTPAPTAAPVETPVPLPVTVPVYYLNLENDQPVASADFVEVQPGTEVTVSANPRDLQPDFVPADENQMAQQVVVDEYGVANVTEVVFYYLYMPPTPVPTEVPAETLPPAQPVTLPILYLDEENGLPVATEGSITLNPDTITDVHAQPQDLLADYVLSAYSPASQTVHVDAFGYTNVMEIVFYYVYSPAPTPAPTEAPILPQEITIWYYSTDYVQIAEPTTFLCQPGINLVSPNQPALDDSWVLQGEDSVQVLLDDTGFSPESVIFFYQQKQPAATMAPMPVTIRYLDEQGNSLRPDENIFLPAGDTPVTAPDTLDNAYVLVGENTRIIHVDAFGAQPSVVVFTYRNSAVAPKVALVTVKYVDAVSGSTLFAISQVCTEGVENLVRADLNAMLQNGFGAYQLVTEETVSVTVDANGTATPAEVVFGFEKPEAPTQEPQPTAPPTHAPELQATVPVYYRNEQGLDVAAAQEALCFVGNNTIECSPVNLLPGYVLSGEPYQTVVLNPEGVLQPEMVVFTYVSTATPAPTPFPYEYTPMSKWCYPKNDGINFRTEPNTNCAVIRTVGRKDLGEITGLVVNGDGEQWYMVNINGTVGFMKDTVTRILTDAEVAALFGYTPSPAPSPIPDGTVLDRWGKTTEKVFFRSSMEKNNNNKLGELKKGTPVWVYTLDSMEGESWYAVQVNGQNGYVMASFVALMSQEESENFQSSLASPVPSTSPSPTPYIPTPVPTQVPTPSPVPSQAPTEVPPAYTGYALTLWQVPLRTGVTDDTILEWLPADSLVYVAGQTYVAGEAWSSLQAIASSNYGFIQHNALMPITNLAAEPYLEAIYQQQHAPTPEPQQQYGYAMTLGDGVPLRAFADTNGEINQLLSFGTVASVRGQIFSGDTTWHFVQYNGMWGYVRADQMRMMGEDEVIAYLQSLEKGTPLPTEAPATPAPITQESLSSYGHVQSSSGKVNLRSAPSTDATRIRLLDNYAFALVMGTETGADGKTWYHVSQAGTEGYIQGDYFKVLSLSELTLFLQSEEYQNANSASSQTGSSSSQIQPVEDYNQTIWQNPALMASYEPFNPFTTPTPDPEKLPLYTPTVAPTAPPPPPPTPGLAPHQGGTPPAPGTTRENGSAQPWLQVGLVVVGGGGAVYAYSLHRQNERRRQAIRAQQARQAAARNQMAQQPQMRMAPQQPASQATRTYAQNPYAPAQATGAYKPVSHQTGVFKPQATQAFTPQQQDAPQATQAFTPQQQDAPQATQAFTPQQQDAPQATKAFTPQQQDAPQATKSFTPQQQDAPQVTQAFTPPQQAKAVTAEKVPGEETAVRHRRADRHNG